MYTKSVFLCFNSVFFTKCFDRSDPFLQIRSHMYLTLTLPCDTSLYNKCTCNMAPALVCHSTLNIGLDGLGIMIRRVVASPYANLLLSFL